MKKRSFSNWSYVILAAAIIVGLMAFAVPSSQAQQLNVAGRSSAPGVKIIPADAVISGKTYGEWSAAWQQWAMSVPADGHPLFDTADCSAGQSGSVWFLGGKFCYNNATNCGYNNVVRTCTVPAGKALYVAIFNSEDSALEDPGNPQLAGLRSFVSSMIDQITDVSLEIDGKTIPNPKERFRVESPAFGFTLPENNLLKAVYPPGYADFAAGTYFPGVDEGVYVMLAPPPGQHVVHFTAALPAYSFVLDITYHLNVEDH